MPLTEMLRAILLTIQKELRIAWRDRVGLFMLIAAPIAVITVAGFSLANLYGADPSGQTAYLLPVVDEDQGAVARAIVDALGREHAVSLKPVADRALARRLVRDLNLAGVAIVIPAGTTSALEEGGEPRLILYTDPVKYLEIINVELRVSELCSKIAADAQVRARRRLLQSQHDLLAAIDGFNAAMSRFRAVAEGDSRQASSERARAEHALHAELETARRQTVTMLDDALDRIAGQISAAAGKQTAMLDAAERYLTELKRSRSEFETWFEQLRQLAGSQAAKIPPPPDFPAPPPELEHAAQLPRIDPAALLARLKGAVKVPNLNFAIPAPPSFAALPSPPDLRFDRAAATPLLPGDLGFQEQNLTGGSTRINTFDQNVPGFGVTFVLIGMLIGLSLGLIDERDWGTLHRLLSSAAPIAATLTGKIISRFLIGLGQMLLLFGFGWLCFGISLGPQPLALLMPTAAIAFAGASFGLMVAAVARTRDAVLPVGAIVIMTMAAVGGCWWPIDLEPRWMRGVALGLPTTWTMHAYNDLMIRRLGASSALEPAAITAGFGLLYLMLGLLAVRGRLE